MTNPGDNFQVGEDTVVAKLSVDIPAGSADTLAAINAQAEQLSTNLQAVSRSQSDYLEYLRQIPQLSEQAAQAQRNLITQLERTAYIQQELGGGLANVGTGPAQGGTPYSTAAPKGYVDPFAGMTAGMRSGANQNVAGATSALTSMMQNDPRLYANMLAQRGMTPVTMGMGGANITPVGGGGQGQGAPAPGSLSSQPTQAARGSASPPDGSQMGQASTAEPQNIPSAPRPDAPDWQKTLSQAQAMAQSVVNESRVRGGGVRGYGGAIASAAGGAIASRMGGGGGGGGDGGGGDDGGGGGGGFQLPKGTGIAAGAGGIIGGLMLGNKMIQNAGEQIQKYANLGGERGGGAVEGVGYEAQARIMAMNPFITLEQSRAIMQAGLRSGYTGKEFDTVTEMMATNLKDMNMSAADSMQLFNDTVQYGGQSVEKFRQNMKDLHDLAASGFVGQTEKIAQNVQTANVTGELGFTGDTARNLNLAITEGFADNPMLAHAMPEAVDQAMQNPMFLTQLGRAAGIAGPAEEVPDRLSEMGPDAASKALDKMLRDIAMKFSHAPEARAVTLFRNYLATMGLTLPRREARELYRYIMNGGAPSEYSQERLKNARNRQTLGEESGIGRFFGGVGDLLTGDLSGAWNNFKSLFTGEDPGGGPEAAAGGNEEYEQGNAPPVQQGANPYTAQGRAPVNPPTSAGQVSHSGMVSTQGQVTGEVRITVDQEGRVSAPETVRLSGNQVAVNHGYGDATLNNPAPGDQNYLHSNRGYGK